MTKYFLGASPAGYLKVSIYERTANIWRSNGHIVEEMYTEPRVAQKWVAVFDPIDKCWVVETKLQYGQMEVVGGLTQEQAQKIVERHNELWRP